ncbi:LOW QUALITY PROTEIN: EGF-like and EMI domain-containing protein 1 [Neophocaena asiaeorientalis asiaeorientalis]|uniref:LOW QUALITY PROTEIN: EGF-like and EMI domain-containing protein 1 n=1 Tax=Neophocaena asiaeorientalis asiaeorientalis TaxID=1706337 RepID=A0A341C227_NEOAA|nr:LOW QUALITY PROTEIN: EGF-like and EMI domain-containing protein 1 [Neophocaena asiaeorientalis asiaeorientalis]
MYHGVCQDQCCNTIGSYYCKCQAGQKLEEDGRGCEDVDECTVVSGGCQQRCINTLGTFHCACDTGYSLHADEHTCIPMDPCMGGNGCAHICQSEHGVARSACHPGYQLSEYKKACADVNECAEGLASCSHRCVNTVESFTCACHPGFELGADGKQCSRIELEIVNSCEKNNGGCSCHYEHAVGGPCCSCNHGHRLDSDEKTCIDLDECESGEACWAQLCINYLGGYECSCQEGFRISSVACGCDALDDDELKEEEEELDIVKFPRLLFKSPPQLLHYVATSLPLTHEGEEDELEEGKDIRGELTALHRVVCLDSTSGHDCTLSCEDCMNGGWYQEGKSRCSFPAGWGDILCHETCSPETSGKEYDGICDCQNRGTYDPLSWQCECPSWVHGKTCEDGDRVASICLQTVPREPMELAALQNVSVWRRTSWNAVPKMAVAPANLVTKATDDRKDDEKGFKKISMKGVAGSKAKVPAAKNNWAFMFSGSEWRINIFSRQRPEEAEKIAVGISPLVHNLHWAAQSQSVDSMRGKTNCSVAQKALMVLTAKGSVSD